MFCSLDVCNKLAEAFCPDTKAFFGDTKAFFAEPFSRQVSQGRFLKEKVFFDGNDKQYVVTARSENYPLRVF